MIVIVAAIAYAGIIGLLYFAQERMIFPASTLPPDYVFTFDQPFEELSISVPGATLDALHFRQPNPRGLVFFLHGNAGDLTTWTTGIDFYRRINYDLFIFDYRGYGKSTGRIESEAQLHADVRAAWDRIAPEYNGKPIAVYGRSLGTGLAAYLAREVNPALLIMVTPYVSLAAAAKRTYPLAPEWLLKYPLRTDAIIGEIKTPIVLVHGTRDALLPLADSEALRKLARSPVELLIIDDATHGDIHLFPTYLDGLALRLKRLENRE
ncbi:MAG: alpha/beta fold hydrolase [Casimicrobiaceae bacterium]